MNIVEQVRLSGVVGAGGAGFPTHVKLGARAEYVIANGAECEPLLRVDQLLMQRRADRVVRGMELAMQATGAKQGVIATKAHYEGAVKALKAALGNRKDITLHLMDSYYPSGDEKSIIYEVTGRVVPSAKLPADVGCVVSNVATLCNIADAAEGRPVVDKDVTVGGDVPHPLTVTVPVGTPMREVIALSGFTGAKEDYALIAGGPCMGKLEEDWDAPVTKTTGGLLMLRRTHLLIARRTQSPERLLKIARAVCCQCSQCTQMCPRNALGLHVEPHKAMRAITTGNGALLGNALDNAMEACAKAEKPQVRLRCRLDKGMLMLIVSNPLAGDEKDGLSTTKADVKNHGFGLPGMAEIARRLGGSLDACVKDGRFELVACIPHTGAAEV